MKHCSECEAEIHPARLEVVPHTFVCSPACSSARQRRLSLDRMKRWRRDRRGLRECAQCGGPVSPERLQANRYAKHGGSVTCSPECSKAWRNNPKRKKLQKETAE